MSDRKLYWISKCDECEGNGFTVDQEPGYGDSLQSVPAPCDACGGTGEIREEARGEREDDGMEEVT